MNIIYKLCRPHFEKRILTMLISNRISYLGYFFFIKRYRSLLRRTFDTFLSSTWRKHFTSLYYNSVLIVFFLPTNVLVDQTLLISVNFYIIFSNYTYIHERRDKKRAKMRILVRKNHCIIVPIIRLKNSYRNRIILIDRILPLLQRELYILSSRLSIYEPLLPSS